MEKKLFIGVCVGCLLVMGYFGYIDRKERLEAERIVAEKKARENEIKKAPYIYYEKCNKSLFGYLPTFQRETLCGCIAKENQQVVPMDVYYDLASSWKGGNPLYFHKIAPKKYQEGLFVVVNSCEFSLYY